MKRPRALVRRTSAASLGFVFTLGLIGCNAEVEKLSRRQSTRASLGQEIYKTLCRRVAANEMPRDLDGRNSEALCLGNPQQASDALELQRGELTPRLVALVERRQSIVDALDETLPDELGDGLEQLLRALVPFYDPPGERMQQNTRALADVLTKLAADDAALTGLARFGRAGMLPPEGDFGLLRGLFGYDDLAASLGAALPPLTGDLETAAAFEATLRGLALELATNELEADPQSDACRTRALLQRGESASTGEPLQFGTGAPLHAVLRDVRGMPVPARADGAVGRDLVSACGDEAAPALAPPYPFVDADGDGFADIAGPSFVLASSFDGALPEPYAVPGEAGVERDALGRARALDGAGNAAGTLYETRDMDGSLLAAVVREGARLFQGEHSAFSSAGGAMRALLGEGRETRRDYGKYMHSYGAPDPAQCPAVDLVHASGALMADPVYDDSLAFGLRLLREHESELVRSIEPLLASERRSRPVDDAYPGAQLERPNTFWDELLFEVEKLSRRRKTAGGETMLEGLLRSMLGTGRNFQKDEAPVEQLVDADELSHQGAILATMLRFKDEWRVNPVSESKRKPGEPGVIGSFRTPVDRDKPDAPITCGRDGCAGPVVGSPFERFRVAGQNCVIQRKGRPASGKDCGEPANQSLFHRSMGMLAEMEGRSQCNRRITVDDLFDFASNEGQPQTPQERAQTIRDAENALAKDYTCPTSGDAPCRAYADKFPAAFADADGAGPEKPAIAVCGLLDLADVGRTFGKVLTHEYVLDIPNPWVQRYLEDIARAADPNLTPCPDNHIVDPTQVPTCLPEAARLSRDVFDELGSCLPSEDDCVDTLGELVEFLLDDKQLFQTARDGRDLRPDARALSRVMFTPAGSNSFLLFEPLLLRGAPKSCAAAPGVAACVDDVVEPEAGCCIKDPMDPPLRYRLDTFYGSTTFAWEQSFKLADGGELSFIEAMGPISDAFNRLDYAAGDEANGIEDKRYALTVLGSIVATHFDSPANPAAQNKRPGGLGYRKLTGLVRYEELLADLLDDGSIVHAQNGPAGEPLFDPALRYEAGQQLGLVRASLPMLRALDALEVTAQRDGIAESARIAESWLNPHVYCAGSDGDGRVLNGRGACDEGGVRSPLTTWAGRDHECWNDGTCFDGKGGRARRYLSPADLLIDAAADVKNRALKTPEQQAAARGVLSGLLDAFAQTADGKLARRRVRALALTLGDYMRERWAEERAAGRLSDWGKRTTEDVIDLLTNPAVAGALSTMYSLSKQPGALEGASRWLGAVMDERNVATSRALIAFAADAVQALPGDASSNALLRLYANAAAPNIADVLAGRAGTLEVAQSLLLGNVFVLGELGKADDDNVLGKVLANALRAPGQVAATDTALPASALFDAVMDINRVDPARQAPHDAADYRAAFTRMSEVLTDEHHGFERLYKMVQCTRSKRGSCQER